MDFRDIPSSAWAALLTPIIMWLLLVVGRGPVKQDAYGWTRLRPSIGLYILGVACALLALAGTAVFVGSFVVPAQTDTARALLAIRILYPLLTALMVFGTYTTLVVSIEFGDEGVRFRGFFRRFIVSWEDIAAIVDSWWYGPFLQTPKGRLPVMKYFRGFPQLKTS